MNNDVEHSTSTEKDCAVCLQKCHHPTQLPCGHVFCFLCVKGVAIQSKKCAMCRAVIPLDYLDHPVLLEKPTFNTATEESNVQNHQWYYEGRNGWWKYDERSNDELETAWNAHATECSLLLAGAVYTIDFQSMVQTRRNDRTKRRHVRRDAPSLPVKGIAGIKIIENNPNEDEKTETGDTNSGSPHSQREETSESNVGTEDISHNTEGISDDVETNSNEEPLDDVINNLDSLNINAHAHEPEDT